MKALLLEMKKAVEEARQEGLAGLSGATLDAFAGRYRCLVLTAHSHMPDEADTGPAKKGRM